MATNRIDGVRLKIERAKKHIRDLESVVIPFFDANPYTYTADLHPEISHYCIRLETVKALPETIPVMIGDAVHNLRSALDHLAWQLVESGGGVPNRDTSFPIIGVVPQGSQRYATALGKGEISKVPPGADKILESVQPYQTGDDTLVAIHTLDIWDKHRLIVAVYATLGAWGLQSPKIWFGTLGFGTPVVVGDEICRIPQDTWDKAHKNINFGFHIAFGDPEIVKGRSVLETLNEMADFISAIVGQFEPYLC